tara:strand:+ start:579 stop:2123 length:1545 start_codon:yes stop_codon:yes gene_type:complete
MIKLYIKDKILCLLFITCTLILNFNFILFDYLINDFHKNFIIFFITLSFCLPALFYYQGSFNLKIIPLFEIILIFFILSYIAIFFFSEKRVILSYSWLGSTEPDHIYFKVIRDLIKFPFNYLQNFYYATLSFLTGYYIFLFLYFKKKIFTRLKIVKYNFIFTNYHYYYLGLILFFFQVLFFLIIDLNSINIVLQFKESLIFMSVLCLSNFIFNEKKNYLSKIISLIIILASCFISLIETGSQITVTLILMLIIMNYWFTNGKIFFVGILLVVLNFYYFQDIKIVYRASLHKIPVELRTPVSKIQNYATKFYENLSFLNAIKIDSFKKKMTKQGKNKKILSNEKLLSNKNRVSLVRLTMSSVAYKRILDMHKENKLNLKRGETYKPLIFFFIPRALWPDKPKSSFGIEYGLTASITDERSPTSINVSWISESFWNFGNFFFIAMFIKGIIISIISSVFIFKNQCAVFYSWLAVSFPLVIAESNTALMLGPIFFKFIFLILIISAYKFFFIKNEKN